MDFLALSQECAPWVATQTMAAIVKTESGFNPLLISVNGGAKLVRQPENKAEAVSTARWLIEKGYNIDLGLGQVNSSNLVKVGLSVEDAFEPCKNLAAAATILQGNFQVAKGKVHDDQAALHAALSAYNTGSFSKGFLNGYVQKVLNNAGVTVQGVSAQQAVKLKAAGEDKEAPQGSGVNVYDTNTNDVMVY
ncbi:lytic transglycosylase domain-containing protein [Xylella fastidiosa]|uniref:Lytic transglycosylase domain-containing protein n=2 Tax=Xylella fastidiosa TaxID=2371 RepID=A0AAJ5R2R2_XYLFS|nr:lytic transglycosylase domain-containing protein [Xylella fastidiosa]WCF29602.1 lytic transglycosylase domain-containing protein [Xylella fastidiosa subsp. fastidiosa]